MADTMIEAAPSVLVERCNDAGDLLGVVQLDAGVLRRRTSTCRSCTRS